MTNLRDQIIRLAYEKPELRGHLLPLIKSAGEEEAASGKGGVSGAMVQFLKEVGDQKVKNPDTGNQVKIKSLKGERGSKLQKELFQKWKAKQDGKKTEPKTKGDKGKAKEEKPKGPKEEKKPSKPDFSKPVRSLSEAKDRVKSLVEYNKASGYQLPGRDVLSLAAFLERYPENDGFSMKPDKRGRLTVEFGPYKGVDMGGQGEVDRALMQMIHKMSRD